MEPAYMIDLLEYYTKGKIVDEKDEAYAQMLKDLNAVDGDCVVFNFECCAGCSDHSFHHPEIAFDLVDALLKQK